MTRRRYSRYDYYFPPSTPREAKGGIRAQNQRGTFGTSWWAKRWIGVLESFHIGARLNRGRSYARQGQVTAIHVDKGIIKASVQGSRAKPYTVMIKLNPFNKEQWNTVVEELKSQPLFTAKLLAGDMPQDIEEVFKKRNLSLFPEKYNDMHTQCSCPDWSNPCKHIAAVYYLLGEEFDRDPFLLFKLRGMDRDELLATLSQSALTSASLEEVDIPPALPPEPLTADGTPFWQGLPVTNDLFGEVELPTLPAAIPKQLGPFPYWRGSLPFIPLMEIIYTYVAEDGLKSFLGELDQEAEEA
ncbi:MAG: SWIM zinc finger family protein [bacterium]|nr:SWIM zinc finger family protein [bacterium]